MKTDAQERRDDATRSWFWMALFLAFASATLCIGQQPDRYAAAHDQALKARRPLVVGVGCAPPSGEWESVATTKIVFQQSVVEEMPGFQPPCIVVAAARQGWMEPIKVLPPTATAADVRRALGVRGGSASEGAPSVSPPSNPILPRKWNPYDRKENPRNERQGAGASSMNLFSRSIECRT